MVRRRKYKWTFFEGLISEIHRLLNKMILVVFAGAVLFFVLTTTQFNFSGQYNGREAKKSMFDKVDTLKKGFSVATTIKDFFM